MQVVKSRMLTSWDEIFREKAIANIKQLMERVEYLAQKSECPELKVAYVLIDKDFNEISFAVNKYKSEELKRKYRQNRSINWLHAEEQLVAKIVQSHTAATETCAIGNFSPCRYCVSDLKAIGVSAIVFSNLYWDTPALALAESLGMQLFYFSGLRLNFLTHSVISGLSNLNIVPLEKHEYGQRFFSLGTSITEEEKNVYIKTHKTELTDLLNILLAEFLTNELRSGGLRAEKISRVLSQIDTEQVCLRWARSNIILRKQPW